MAFLLFSELKIIKEEPYLNNYEMADNFFTE